jgi:hypothetical protein
MDKNISSKLVHDLEPLQARIEEHNAKCQTLKQELSRVESELEALAGDRPRYEALQEVCTALGKLSEKDAKDLFWSELPEVADPEEALPRLCRAPGRYLAKIEAARERRAAIQEQIKQCRNELAYLEGQVDDAYQREQKRNDEFVVEREVAFFPMHATVMPWSKEAESERYFRRSVLIALLICFLFGGLVPLIEIPVQDRYTEMVEIPERIAKLVKAPPAVPEVPPAPQVAEVEPEKVEEEKPEEKKPEKEEPPKAEEVARKKVQNTGVLAFQDSFKDLIVDAPKAQLGKRARIANKAPRAAGKSLSRSSLVAMQATGTSGGISASAVSRNIATGEGSGSRKQISGVAFSRVESSVAGMAEKEDRKLSAGPSPGRSDEEIQIVFDRYKATLYRIYNKELRKDPTLRGNILLRLSIEQSGAVSACSVESTDLASPALVENIVARVLKFNFGPKKSVQTITILYPIDFLPAG